MYAHQSVKMIYNMYISPHRSSLQVRYMYPETESRNHRFPGIFKSSMLEVDSNTVVSKLAITLNIPLMILKNQHGTKREQGYRIRISYIDSTDV